MTTARALFGPPRVFEVGFADRMYNSVDQAVAAINADPTPPSTTNRVMILVYPGRYVSNSIVTIPSFVGVKGVSKYLVQFQNNETTLFKCGGTNCFFEDFTIDGSTTSPGLFAFDGNNQNALHIHHVDLLGTNSRQRFLIQEGATWSILTLDRCVVNYQGVDEFAVRLTNSAGGGARFVDTWVDSCFFDAFFLTNFGGSFDLRDVQDCRFWNCTIRGTNADNGGGLFFNTGIRHRKVNAGTPNVEIAHCRMSGALMLSGGRACSGDASTQITIHNSLARGAISSGTLTTQNSFITQ